MNILITRPLIDSEDLMGKLFSLGHKIVHIPTLKISAANASPVDAKKYDVFYLFVSQYSKCYNIISKSSNMISFYVISHKGQKISKGNSLVLISSKKTNKNIIPISALEIFGQIF